jgi:hypothetical protein
MNKEGGDENAKEASRGREKRIIIKTAGCKGTRWTCES